MPEYCTCGAKLPEDARFCHKCGKPQRESDIAPEPPPPAPVAEVDHTKLAEAARVIRRRAADPSIGFRNPITVRTALLSSVLGFVVFALVGQISALLALLVMVGAGIFAVYLYRRRTGLPVSVRGGAHIGWMTGTFCFAAALVLVTVMAVALTNNDFASLFESQLGARSSQEIARQVLDSFRSAKGLAEVIEAFFVACGIMPTLGGAIGALLGRRVG